MSEIAFYAKFMADSGRSEVTCLNVSLVYLVVIVFSFLLFKHIGMIEIRSIEKLENENLA